MRLIAALLAVSLPLAANGRAQLLPAGEFAARDGRPVQEKRWTVSDVQGRALAAQINATASLTPIVIDYEHQTMLSQENGQPAPAAGWIKSAEWQDGKGLFATVEWTAKARAHIDAGEYRFISPVITFDKSGQVTGVLNAALVNFPALLGMEPVVAQLAAQFPNPQQETDMALLAALIAALGLPATTTETEITTAIKAQHGELQALKAKPAVPAALATALGVKADADEPTAVAALAAMKGGTDSATTRLATLTTEVATLQTQLMERDLQELLDSALKAHKITPAEVESLKTIGKKDIAWLRTHLTAKTPIAGLSGQSKGDHNPAHEGSDQNADDIAKRATAYQHEQLKAGINVSTVQAVDHVMAAKAK